MKRKVFALSNVLVLLLIAGMLAVLAVPKTAEADHLATIEWIRIYKLGDSITRSQVTQAQLPPNFNAPGGNGPGILNPGNNPNLAGYFEIDDTSGEPKTGIRVTSSETVLGAGDIVGIAVRFKDISDIGWTTRISLADWKRGGPEDTTVQGRSIPHGELVVNHWFGNTDWTVSGQENLDYFTALFSYQIRPGDFDDDGEWFRRDGSNLVTPFVGGQQQNPVRIWHRSGRTHEDPPGYFTYDDSVTPIVYPKIDGSVSLYPTVESLTINKPPAGQSGQSRYHKVRQGCLEDHRKYGDIYTAACELVHDNGWALPTGANAVTLANSPRAFYLRAGDPFEVKVKFSKAVQVDTDNPPSFYAKLDAALTECIYVSGTGTDELTFQLEGGVKTFRQFYEDGKLQTEGHKAFGAIELGKEGFRPNTHKDWRFRYPLANPRIITDLEGREFDTNVDLEPQLWAFVSGIPNLTDDPRIQDAATNLLYVPVGEYSDAYAFGIIKYLVDTIPETVWIPGIIKNGVTHIEDRRIAAVNLDASYTEIPAMTGEDFREPVTESDVQTGPFDVEFRFFNEPGAIAGEVGESFTGDDVEITGGDVVRSEWQVETTYVGLDNRATNQWPPSDRPGQPAGSAHKPGHAKNSGSFLVYKAPITPPLGFQGDVAIRLPAGATQDIARNDSLASNTLTVPVNIPFQVVETPEIVEPPAGVYTVGEKIEVEVTYNREGLRYVGKNPPYLTLYLGEEVPANARHAVWSAQEDANSTKVTFTYTVAGNDFAESLRVAEEIGLTVPSGTRLVDNTGSQLSGAGESAKGSGEGLEKLPTEEQALPLKDPSGREVSPVVSDTPVVPYTPILEVEDPKAAASDVPRSPVVFNELGNGSGDTEDWLELRNVTGSAVSLKDWELSIVQDGKKEDTSLIAFVEDVSVPANGLLLLVNTSPDKTSLAGGDDISTADVEKKGSPHLYLVNAGLSLPDDGKFLLILRNAKEKLGLNEAFVDVAGGGGSDTDAFVREQTGDYDTHVWPLQVREAPGGDTEDALGSGKVWQRAKADIVGYHKDAWAESAFTGIGYDRKVTESPATSGTPGYPNGALKPGTATPKGSVTLSEIMFDSGGGTLPQWIELYNNSKTDAINLNRWELEIQNVDSEDLVGRPIVTLTLSEKVIQPNQTLLIVTGPARASSDSYLPADRVYDLLALHEKNLRIKRARDTFLSTEGFYLKLSDRNENLVDEVGNRDSDRRSDDAPAWALPLSAEAGVRSSLIRRYDKGVALPGRKRASWVLAARVKKVVSSSDALHWGDADDIGTPGHREGGALPVELSSFSMTRTEAGAVVLTWTTESEVDNAGFNLRRSEKRASGFTLLNPTLIAGAGTTGERQTYTFTDTSAKPGVEYYYQIEEVAFDGKRETLVTRLLPGPVSASNRMLTTFGEVKQQE